MQRLKVDKQRRVILYLSDIIKACRDIETCRTYINYVGLTIKGFDKIINKLGIKIVGDYVIIDNTKELPKEVLKYDWVERVLNMTNNRNNKKDEENIDGQT